MSKVSKKCHVMVLMLLLLLFLFDDVDFDVLWYWRKTLDTNSDDEKTTCTTACGNICERQWLRKLPIFFFYFVEKVYLENLLEIWSYIYHIKVLNNVSECVCMNVCV